MEIVVHKYQKYNSIVWTWAKKIKPTIFILFATVLSMILIIGAKNSDLTRITPWLLGANFTVSAFSINFTFFGHQLSKYKAIYDGLSKRQWLNLFVILILPFSPLILYLFVPEFFEYVALGILPFLVLSSIDNALLTSNYLNPEKFIFDITKDSEVDNYLNLLSKELKVEVEKHKRFKTNLNKFQIPPHGIHYEPSTLGLTESDIWDSLSIITNLSVENKDYPIFRKCIYAIMRTLIKSYSYDSKSEDYQVDSGIKFVTRKRFRSIINNVVDNDSNGIFLQALSGELCDYLIDEALIDNPCSDMTRAVATEAIWIGKKMLEVDYVTEPLKVLNTIHEIIEVNLYRLTNIASSSLNDNLEIYDICAYAYDIKALGVSALENSNNHFTYRCMESLSYLGCNAAKLKSEETVTAVLESIVHLARLSRSLKIGCFDSRCLIPAESHAEEFLGHILTWLISDFNVSNGKFFMKDYMEQAYSRIRGVKCVIKPRPNSNPIFWIKELKENDEVVPHIEYENGMYGYGGNLDYSNFDNLKEYKLYGIGSENESLVIRTPPMPIEIIER